MKQVFRNTEKVLILLNMICIFEVSAQCNKGNQELKDNQGEEVVAQDPTATSNTGVQAASDPNEIIGLDGYNAPESADTLRWVSAMQTLAYTVYFENDADLAIAAARKVSVTLPLHEKLNSATFKEDKQL